MATRKEWAVFNNYGYVVGFYTTKNIAMAHCDYCNNQYVDKA